VSAKVRWNWDHPPAQETQEFMEELAQRLESGPFELREVVYAPGFSLHLIIAKVEVRGMPYAYWLPETDIQSLKLGPSWLAGYIEIEALKAEQRGRDRRGTRRHLASGDEDQAALREDGPGAFDVSHQS
jgi:hypothetical protein